MAKLTTPTKNPIRTIVINGVEYKVKRTIKAMFIMEQVTRKPFAIKTLQEQYLFFWCMLYANNPESCIDYDAFIDALDEDETLIPQLLKLNEDEDKRDGMMRADKADGDKKKVAAP